MSGKTPDERKKKNSVDRTPDPGNVMLFLYTLAALLCILVGGVLSAAEAAVPDVGGGAIPEIRRGELLVPDSEGKPTAAMLLAQDVKISISGIVARVTVAQRFENTGREWVNGLYVFPLPDESAVDRLRMQVGAREVVGEIREKGEAEELYEQAVRDGKKSSLLTQNRPNMFTTRVANIGPGETVGVTVEYQQLVQLDDNVFSLRYPLAITPRYIPGRPVERPEKKSQAISFDGKGWAVDTDQVNDASAITPPVIDAADPLAPRVTLSVDLASGFPLAGVTSLYHGMDVTERSRQHFQLSFSGEIAADRDFVLEWVPEGKETAAALFSEQRGDSKYMLLMLMPAAEPLADPPPREVIFVLDVSGSMAGPSIRQAKAAMRRSLAALRSRDLFNIITFNHTARSLFAASRPGSTGAKREAEAYLAGLQANGGTEMKSGLDLALDGRRDHERIRQVIFLTDGAVGNETALLEFIRQRLGNSRLFTVGIGAAPNNYFMTRAASAGRGSHTSIGDIHEVEERVAQLLSRLENPAVTDIRVEPIAAGAPVEFYPDPVPDLYYGEPLVLAIKGPNSAAGLRISGDKAGAPVEYYISTSGSGSRPGIASLWARKKIRNLMESMAFGADKSQVRQEVTAAALSHRLVSKYTSLVAVDSEPSRPPGEESVNGQVKSVLPRGLQLEAVFGGGARTATPSPMLLVTGGWLLMIALLIEIGRRRKWARHS